MCKVLHTEPDWDTRLQQHGGQSHFFVATNEQDLVRSLRVQRLGEGSKVVGLERVPRSPPPLLLEEGKSQCPTARWFFPVSASQAAVPNMFHALPRSSQGLRPWPRRNSLIQRA